MIKCEYTIRSGIGGQRISICDPPATVYGQCRRLVDQCWQLMFTAGLSLYTIHKHLHILKLWHHIKNLTQPIDAFLLKEQSCHMSYWLIWNGSAVPTTTRWVDPISQDMGSVLDPKITDTSNKQESPAVADKPAWRLKSASRVIQGHRKWH